MGYQTVFTLLVSLVITLTDWRFFKAVQSLITKKSLFFQRIVASLYWGTYIFLITYIWSNFFWGPDFISHSLKQLVVRMIFLLYASKLVGVCVLLLRDLIQALKVKQKPSNIFQKPASGTINPSGHKISRADFLNKMAVIAGTAPMAMGGYGIISGAHDYQTWRKTIYLPNLPKAFDGIRLGQISDIHTGSFFNSVAVSGGIEKLLGEKPDIIFFTGDLVNYESREVHRYFSILQKLKAPLGVYSVLGNHDYGEYRSWPNKTAKAKNFADMLEAHRLLGWDLLRNENRFIEVEGEKIALLGVGNWGIRGRSSKYGRLGEAYQGSENSPVKLLLSHDPSHWRAQVVENYADIDLTLSGHTHGMQCGIEIGGFQWSPIQYIYQEWAGLYQEAQQYLYVNRGFGYSDIFPGRVGILPEITIIELKSGQAQRQS